MMIFRSPSERTQMILLSPVILATAPVWLLLISILWAQEKFTTPEPATRHWRRWFAWWPVEVGGEWEGKRCQHWRRQWAWLCLVEKGGRGAYRLIKRGDND